MMTGNEKTHGWRPIETAPKDETPILAYCPNDLPTVYVIMWNSYMDTYRKKLYENWVEAGGEQYEVFYPTHWMPLPEPPVA
jgi:hypothetical protein